MAIFIAANDDMTSVLLARLSQRLSTAAPLVNLVVRPATRLDLAEPLVELAGEVQA